MTLALAGGKKQRKAADPPDKLPILLFLRDHSAAIKENEDLSLVDAVQSTLKRWDMDAPEGWLERQLERGNCLVLLDGLDEVADPDTRRKVVSWVERQMQRHGNNRFLISSRPHGYHSNPLGGVNVLEVRPFNSRQVKHFVNNWYLANEIMSAQKDDPGVRMAAQEGAEDLLQRLRSTPALSDLGVNPLLLTMIATVHRYKSSLPGRRVELFKEICEVFLGKRQQAKGLSLDLTPAQKQRVLQPLAWHMMCHEQREIDLAEALTAIEATLQLVSPNIQGKDFLKTIEQDSGLLLERESGEYSFAHLTFQEYLAAVHANEQQLVKELATHIAESWWHETLRLYAAQADASSILAACLEEDTPPIPALILAIEIEEEALEIQPQQRRRFEEMIEQGVEANDPERRRVVAEAMLAHRLQHMIRVDDDTYVDPGFISHAEYQLFLDEKRAQGEYYQPDHWQSHLFPVGLGQMPVAGVRGADAQAFCVWLTERIETIWRYRLPTSHLLSTAISTPNMLWWTEHDQEFMLEGKTTSVGINLDVCGNLGLNPEGERNITRILRLVRNIDDDSTYGLDRDLYIDLSRSLGPITFYFEQLLDLLCNRIPGIENVLDIENSLSGDISCMNDLDLVQILDTASKLVMQRHYRSLYSALDEAFRLAYRRDLHFDLNRIRARVADLDRRGVDSGILLNRSSGFARELISFRDIAFDHFVSSHGLVVYLTFIRLNALLAAVEKSGTLSKPSDSRPSILRYRNRSASEQHSHQFFNSCLDCYINLVILEERIEGRMEAVEGIRIVRERKRKGEEDGR